MISFYDIVRVLLDDVPRCRREVIKHAGIDRCPVGRDLDRGGADGVGLKNLGSVCEPGSA